MPKLYLVSRVDFRGSNPIKVFVLKDNAKQYCGECNIAVKLVMNSENREEEFSLIKEFDSEAVLCDSIRYEVEEIQSE